MIPIASWKSLGDELVAARREVSGRGPVVDQVRSSSANGFVPPWNGYGSPGFTAGSFRSWPYPDGGRWPDHCVISIQLER